MVVCGTVTAVVGKWRRTNGLCCPDKWPKWGEMGEDDWACPVPRPDGGRVPHGRHSRRSGRNANAVGGTRGYRTAPLQRGGGIGPRRCRGGGGVYDRAAAEVGVGGI